MRKLSNEVIGQIVMDVQFYYQDWQGKNVKKRKRGFKTKREALAWESEFKNSVDVNMNITLAEFVEIYFQDKSGELKERSIKNKRYMLERHVIPYLGKRRMDEITPSDVINWQKVMREKGYKPTYLRMVNNQLVALFTHAHNIYNLENSPCKKVKKMGKSDADKLSFWTKQDFDLFMATVDKRDRYYLIFMILFWTGCREGDADGKISLNQQKPSKHAGLRRFGPEKFLQRNNEFMKERPIFYKKPIKTEKDFSTWLRCFYYTTKAVITEYIYF